MHANIEARNAFTQKLDQQRWFIERTAQVDREQKIAMTAHEAAEELFGWVYKQPGMPTLDDCIDACERVILHFGDMAGIHLLQREGVEKLKDMWIGSYVGFVAFCNACIEYNVPPGASWDRVGDTEWKPYQQEEL